MLPVFQARFLEDKSYSSDVEGELLAAFNTQGSLGLMAEALACRTVEGVLWSLDGFSSFHTCSHESTLEVSDISSRYLLMIMA